MHYLGRQLTYAYAFLILALPSLLVAQPKFVANEIPLEATAGKPYQQDLKKLLEDPNLTGLVFAADNDMPSWLSINGNLLEGNPNFSHLGTTYEFFISVKDSNDLGAITKIKFTVLCIPEWISDPLDLGIIKEDEQFSTNLYDHLQDLDPACGPVQFTLDNKTPMTEWLSLNGSFLSGIPEREHVGTFNNLTVIAKTETPAIGDSSAQIRGTVVKQIKPPEWGEINIPNAKEEVLYSANIKGAVKDYEGEPFTISKLTASPSWLDISSDGKLSGTPSYLDVGSASVDVRVSQVIDGQTYKADTTFQIIVDHVNHPPVWDDDPIELPDAYTGVDYLQTLAESVTDIDIEHGFNDKLTFTIKSGPPSDWITLKADGTEFKGNPAKVNVGLNSWIVEVSDGEYIDATTVRVNVIKSNEPPVWLSAPNPTILKDAKEDSFYEACLNDRVRDPDNDPVEFSIISIPSWLNLEKVGEDTCLRGRPGKNDLELNVFRLAVTDNISAGSNESDIHIYVEHVNHPPEWNQKPITYNTNEDQLMQKNLSPYIEDPDVGDTLTCVKTGGPDWASFAPGCIFTGTPLYEHKGTNTFSVQVRDQDGAFDNNTVVVEVIHLNEPPIVDPEKLEFSVKERKVRIEELNDYIIDLEGDTLNYKSLDDKPWIQLSSQGKLTLSPTHDELGHHEYRFEVTDNITSPVEGTIRIEVLRDPQPPIWDTPIEFTATALQTFSDRVDDKVTEIDNYEVTFTKVDGKTWLTVGTTGLIRGMPRESDFGPNEFTIRATNSYGKFADATITINVREPNHPPQWTEDPIELPDGEVNVFYTQDIKHLATDPDPNAQLACSMEPGGPQWIQIDANCKIIGTPREENTGMNEAEVRVSDEFGAFDIATVKIFVRGINHPPEWINDPVPLSNPSLNTPYYFDLRPHAKDVDGDDLTFKLISGPSWMEVSEEGIVSGTPTTLGFFDAVFEVSDGLLKDEASARAEVIEFNNPPEWLEDPIRLSTKVNVPFSDDLSRFAKDKDGDTLAYDKLAGGPTWLTVNTNGTMSGQPTVDNLGENEWTVRVRDTKGATATALLIITVNEGNSPPYWTQDVIDLGNITVAIPYGYDIAQFAKDDDDDFLKFKKVENSGPGWISVDENGLITGTPGMTNLGPFSFVVEVTDNISGSAQVGVIGEVVEGSDGTPIVTPEAFRFIMKECQVISDTLNRPEWVYDPDGDPLTFALLSPTPSWLQLQSNGSIVLSPKHPHIDDHEFDLRVSDDDGNSVDAKLRIRVTEDAMIIPSWLQDPLFYQAKVGENFSQSVVSFVDNSCEMPLSFTKTGGPNWLTVTPQGMLQGQPTSSNVGQNDFTVQVRNAHNPNDKDVVIKITVESSGKPHEYTVDIDQPVPGAQSENLWVVDHSWPSRKLSKELRREIDTYYDILDRAEVHHHGVVISSAAKAFDGKPLPVNGTKDPVLAWNQVQNIASDFVDRVESAWILNCLNSPIWSMFRFYERVPGITLKDYMKPNAPMDVLIVTKQKDCFECYTEDTPQDGWSAERFAAHFIDFHEQRQKPYRISAVACPNAVETTTPPPGVVIPPEMVVGKGENAEKPYRALVNATKGEFYEIEDCKVDMNFILRDYAEDVIFRSNVLAKSKIKLSPPPIPGSPIQLFINSTEIPQSSGKWSFQAPDTVLIRWELFDFSLLNPGDRLRIKYTTAG